MQKDEKRNFSDRIKESLRNRALREKKVLNEEIVSVKVSLDAMLEGFIHEIDTDKVALKEYSNKRTHNFTASDENSFTAIRNFLQSYLKEHGFVGIDFKDITDRDSKNKRGLVEFTIPD